jgi:hypothetical protein
MENAKLIATVEKLWLIVMSAANALGMEADENDKARLKTIEGLNDRLATVEYDFGSVHDRIEALEAETRGDYGLPAKAAIKALNARLEAFEAAASKTISIKLPETPAFDFHRVDGVEITKAEPLLNDGGPQVYDFTFETKDGPKTVRAADPAEMTKAVDDAANDALFMDMVRDAKVKKLAEHEAGVPAFIEDIIYDVRKPLLDMIQTLNTDIMTRDRLLDDQAATIGKLEAERDAARSYPTICGYEDITKAPPHIQALYAGFLENVRKGGDK